MTSVMSEIGKQWRVSDLIGLVWCAYSLGTEAASEMTTTGLGYFCLQCMMCL